MFLRISWLLIVKICLVWLIFAIFFYVFSYKSGVPSETPFNKKSVQKLTDPNILISVGEKSVQESPSPELPHHKTTNTFQSLTNSSAERTYRPLATSIWVDGLTPIYMITPTYRRAEQIPELTRTAQTLISVKNLVWIVVEDASKPSPEVLQYLSSCGVKNVYLRAEMPKTFLKHKKKPRGVANRNAGIEWIRENATEGVVYFGDDDNTYDLRIFEEIRSTRKISMFPVGLVTALGVSTPIVRDGKVIGFYDGWISGRKYPVDMAGFAITVQVFLDHPTALMPFKVGYEEDGLLKNLNISAEDIEPKAENCTKIWVWHTQTQKNKPVKDSKPKQSLMDTNLPMIQSLLWRGV